MMRESCLNDIIPDMFNHSTFNQDMNPGARKTLNDDIRHE